MNIGIIGMGFVGGTTAKVLEKVHKILPYDKYKEPFTNPESLKLAEVVFICVPTPMKPSGEIDYSPIHDSLKTLKEVTIGNEKKPLVIIRSTAVSGTTDNLEDIYPFHFVFNPEFLREKFAIEDMTNTNRVVIGANRDEDYKKAEEIYKPLFPNAKYIKVDRKTAEMIKYAANVTLAGQTAIANEIYQICKAVGVDYNKVKETILLDTRIGNNIDVPGPDGDLGFGGKCLIAGTKIRRGNEIVNIEDLKVGDKVWDDKQLTSITKFGKRKADRVISLDARGRKIIGSEDHIQIVFKNGKFENKELKKIKVGDWIFVPEQKEFDNPKIISPGSKPNGYVQWWESLKITSEIARLIGLYLAEGCSGKYKKHGNSKSYEVIWSYGESEKDLAKETVDILKKLGLNPFKRLQIAKGTYGESRCWIIRVRSQGLYEIFKKLNLGNNALNKNPPLVSGELAKSMIGGWFDGDGSLFEGTLSACSVNKELILKMDSLLLSLGINSVIKPHVNNAWQIVISMRDDVKKVSSWTKSKRLRLNENRYKRNFSYESPTFKRVRGGWIVRVKKIEELPGQEVYSLETKSHKYVANNILTHNCFPKDLNALIYLARENMYRPYLFEEIWRLNERVRKNKDWLNIPGATSGNNKFL